MIDNSNTHVDHSAIWMERQVLAIYLMSRLSRISQVVQAWTSMWIYPLSGALVTTQKPVPAPRTRSVSAIQWSEQITVKWIKFLKINETGSECLTTDEWSKKILITASIAWRISQMRTHHSLCYNNADEVAECARLTMWNTFNIFDVIFQIRNRVSLSVRLQRSVGWFGTDVCSWVMIVIHFDQIRTEILVKLIIENLRLLYSFGTLRLGSI